MADIDEQLSPDSTKYSGVRFSQPNTKQSAEILLDPQPADSQPIVDSTIIELSVIFSISLSLILFGFNGFKIYSTLIFYAAV